MPISAVARTLTGGTPSREHAEFFGGDIKWAKSGDLRDGVLGDTEESITEKGLENSSAKKCPPGTLLVALYGATTGKVGLLGIEAAINQAICAVVPDDREANAEFLMYSLMERRDVLLAERYGGAQPNISQTVLRAFKMPVPPLPEQRSIASLLRTVQRAKEACEQVIAATRQLKGSLLQHLFTYGPVPSDQAGHVPLKQTGIGEVAELWTLVALEELIAGGPQNGLYKHHSDYGDGTPILRIDGYPNEGGIVTSAANRVRLSDEERNRYGLKSGDLLVNRVNSLSHLGKTALVGRLPEAMVFESNMMRLSVRLEKVLPEWLFRFLCTTAARKALRGNSKRAVAQSSINQGDVKSLVVPLPPLSEQREIARQLSAADAKLVALESRRAALASLFASLLHHLMTGQVRLPEFAGGKA